MVTQITSLTRKLGIETHRSRVCGNLETLNPKPPNPKPSPKPQTLNPKPQRPQSLSSPTPNRSEPYRDHEPEALASQKKLKPEPTSSLNGLAGLGFRGLGFGSRGLGFRGLGFRV